MSFEDQSSEEPAKIQQPTRNLNAALNPALRLQELLRREAGASQSAHALVSPPPAEEAALPVPDIAPAPEPIAIAIVPVSEPVSAAPAPEPKCVNVAPAAVSPRTETAPPRRDELAPFSAPTPRREEPALLVVVVNSERSTPVEYASEEEMPSVLSLEEKHRAYLLSDEWQRRGPVQIRTIRMRRRRNG